MNATNHPAGHVLQAYHDRELDAAAHAAIATHCEQCAACRRELAELADTARLLAAVAAPELPRTVWHRVRPGRARQPRFRPALGLAAGAAGVVLGLLIGPIPFSAETTETQQTWSATVSVWSGGASATLLDVYQSGQE